MAELTLPQVYRRAVEVLDERGWFQGWYVDDAGCKVCALGAITIALGGRPAAIDDGFASAEIDWSGAGPTSESTWGAATDALATLTDDGDVACWNDAPGRNVDQVRALLLRAAEEAERRG